MEALFLVVLNALIIAVTEATGSLFFEKGIIHIIAILFIVAATVPLARNYYLADPIFKKFLNASILAFIVFAVSHVSEYLLFARQTAYSDHVFAVAINLYISSILIMLFGTEVFLRAYSSYHRSRIPLIVAAITIGALVIFSGFLATGSEFLSLEPNSIVPYLYAAAALVIAILLLREMKRVRHAMSDAFATFFRYLSAMLGFVGVSLFAYIFYEFIEHAGVPEVQIVYINHFFFYGGLSIMLLAFEDLLNVGGIVKDIRDRMVKTKSVSP